MDNTQMLLPRTIRASTRRRWCLWPHGLFYDRLWEDRPSRGVPTMVVFSGPWRGAVSFPWCFLPTRGTLGGAVALHKVAQVPCLNQLLYFVFQDLALFGRVTSILMIPTLLATVDIIRAQSPSGWRNQLRTKGFLQYFPSASVEGCVSWELRPTIVSLGITSSRPGPSLSFLLILLLVARLYPSLVSKLAKLFQLHKLGGSTLKFVQSCCRLNTQAVCERTQSEVNQHMMHCHLRAEVSNAHSDLFEPVDELS